KRKLPPPSPEISNACDCCIRGKRAHLGSRNSVFRNSSRSRHVCAGAGSRPFSTSISRHPVVSICNGHICLDAIDRSGDDTPPVFQFVDLRFRIDGAVWLFSSCSRGESWCVAIRRRVPDERGSYNYAMDQISRTSVI